MDDLCMDISTLHNNAMFNEHLSPEQLYYIEEFQKCYPNAQTDFMKLLLRKMYNYQLSQVNAYLTSILQCDFLLELCRLNLFHIIEKIFSYLDIDSIFSCEMVSKVWRRVIHDTSVWRKTFLHRVNSDDLWMKLAHRLNCTVCISPEFHNTSAFYRQLCIHFRKYISILSYNWRAGVYLKRTINCNSGQNRGVYCVQYDDNKVVAGLRDRTIKIWDKQTLSLQKVLTGHTGSVLCLQYDENVIISGSSDCTIRIWDIHSGALLNTLLHHSEPVLHLRFNNNTLVASSKDRTVSVWNIVSPVDIMMRKILYGHRASINVVDFDDVYIVSASGDRTIKVWCTNSFKLLHTLTGHRRGIACLQYKHDIIMSGSSDFSIRIWKASTGCRLKTLRGHVELVRCLKFDMRYIVSGAYDGLIRIWDTSDALDPTCFSPTCIRTLKQHESRVFRIQFDEFQIVSASHDDTIVILDFLPFPPSVYMKQFF